MKILLSFLLAGLVCVSVEALNLKWKLEKEKMQHPPMLEAVMHSISENGFTNVSYLVSCERGFKQVGVFVRSDGHVFGPYPISINDSSNMTFALHSPPKL
jgi:hypothetical protein